MRWLIALGVLVACAQFVYLSTLLQEMQEHTRSVGLLRHPATPQREEQQQQQQQHPQRSETEEIAERISHVTSFVRSIHASFANVRPEGFGVRNSPDRASDQTVWDIFFRATSHGLFGAGGAYHDLRSFSKSPTANGRKIFVSISSFRDEVCPDTLENLWAQAAEPTEIVVGLVQQNCDEEQHDRYGCFTAVLPSDMKVHSAPPDVDCARTYCERPNALEEACRPGSPLLRVLRFNESETYGPVFGRYLGSLLWRGEKFYMQVDAHTTFAKGWDRVLVEDYEIAPSRKAVFSHYPPSGPQRPEVKSYDWERKPGTCMCDAGFAEYSIVRVGAMQRYPYKETSPPGCAGAPSETCRYLPRFAPFIGAGFVFANASFLVDVPFDPFTPFIFMGEEIDFSTRLWTNGWDIFCPPRNAVAHAYLRKQKPKFWGALQRSIGAGAHNSLQEFVLPRVKHKVGYPELRDVGNLATPTLASHLDIYGIGKTRPVADYQRLADLDYAAKRPSRVAWCKAGDRPRY